MPNNIYNKNEITKSQNQLSLSDQGSSCIFKGRKYRAIKKEWKVASCVKCIGKSFMNMIRVIYNLLIAFLKSIGNLFVTSKKNIKTTQASSLSRGGHSFKRSVDKNQTSNSVTDTKQQQRTKIKRIPSRKLTKEEYSYAQSLMRIGYGDKPKIFSLSASDLFDVLKKIKNENIPIDLNGQDQAGKTLFTLWVGKDVELTQIMLELDPFVMDPTSEEFILAFKQAISNSSKKEADLVLAQIQNRNIKLSPEESWWVRAFKNDCNFSKKEFLKLDQDLRLQIFFIANAFANENLVRKLKAFGMGSEPLFNRGFSIIARNMDILTAKDVLKNYFTDLRRNGLLFSSDEFNKLDQSEQNKYQRKSDLISNFQGKSFIEKIVKENGFKHIKVPKQIAVIIGTDPKITVGIKSDSLEIFQKSLVRTYHEIVQKDYRKLSFDEAIELMLVLAKTGYGDIHPGNFVIAKDGIYIIDTKYVQFNPNSPRVDDLICIKNVLDPKDVDKFLIAYEKLKTDFVKEKEKIKAEKEQHEKAFENPFTRLVKGYASQEFTFELSSLE